MAIACDRVRDLASGFVLGALDPAEMTAIREHMGTCRKAHPELRELGGVVSCLGAALPPVEPPARLRAAVLAAAQADLRTRRAAETEAADAAPVRPNGQAIVSLAQVRRSRSRRVALWMTRAAAVVALVGTLGYALDVPGRLGFGGNPNPTADTWGVNEPGARHFDLVPAAGSSANGIAAIRANGHLRVGARSIAPTKNDEVYVVWLAADYAAPVPAAAFRVDSSGKGPLVEIESLPRASTLVITITLEPRPGATEPSGPPILSVTIGL